MAAAVAISLFVASLQGFIGALVVALALGAGWYAHAFGKRTSKKTKLRHA